MLTRRAMLGYTGCLVAGAMSGVSCLSIGDRAARSRARMTSFGLAASVSASSLVRDAGGQHIEDSVQRLLIPDRDDARFAQHSAGLLGDDPLPIVSCASFLPGRLKSVGPEVDTQSLLAWARTAFERASRLGIPVIVFGSAGSRTIPDGFDRADAKRQLVALTAAMAPIAGDHGVTLTIEPLEPAETNFINTLGEAREIVERVDHPALRLTADIYHMGKSGEGPEAITAAAGLVEHVHIAEQEGRATPGVHGEDLSPYFSALREIGYVGAVSIEARWNPGELERGFQTLRTQWERTASRG